MPRSPARLRRRRPHPTVAVATGAPLPALSPVRATAPRACAPPQAAGARRLGEERAERTEQARVAARARGKAFGGAVRMSRYGRYGGGEFPGAP